MILLSTALREFNLSRKVGLVVNDSLAFLFYKLARVRENECGIESRGVKVFSENEKLF